MQNFANSAELHKNCTVSKIGSNFTNGNNFAKRVEFIKYNSISQMVSNFISQIEAEMQTISRPSNKTGVFISGVLFYSHELTFTSLKKIS